MKHVPILFMRNLHLRCPFNGTYRMCDYVEKAILLHLMITPTEPIGRSRRCMNKPCGIRQLLMKLEILGNVGLINWLGDGLWELTQAGTDEVQPMVTRVEDLLGVSVKGIRWE